MFIPGIAWILKRSNQATFLRFGPLRGEILRTAAVAIMKAPYCFGRLTELIFDDHNRSDFFPSNIQCKTSAEDLNLLFMVWMCLVGQTQQLRYLRLTLNSLTCLPCLPSLKHLQLLIPGRICSDLLQSITCLSSLQTLYLKYYNHNKLEAPGLYLAAMPQLQSVALDGIVPTALSLPQGAELHVRVYSLLQARHSVWSSMQEELRTFRLDTCYEDIAADDQLFNFLAKASSLETLVLNVSNFGTIEAPIVLQGAMLKVDRMGIGALDGIYVTVASHVSWQLLNLHSYKELSFTFHDEQQFAMSCTKFSFKYVLLHGIEMMCLCRSMAEEGIKWEYDVCEGVVTIESTKIPGNSYVECITEDDNDLEMCKCKACLYCCNAWAGIKVWNTDDTISWRDLD